MRKGLSLKKTQSNNQHQKQQSIIHFFNRNNAKPSSSQPTQTGSTSKRKATSPVQVDKIESSTDPGISFTPNKSSDYHQSTADNVKKIKRHSSPKKRNNENAMVNHELIYTDKSAEDTNRRSPLSPKKVVNGNCNHRGNENQCDISENIFTPKKQMIVSKDISPSKTSKWSPLDAVRLSPHFRKLLTPEKLNTVELSPSKSGSTVKSLFGEDDVGDMFGEDWDIGDVNECTQEDLDLSIIQRCEVISVKCHANRLEIKLKNNNNNRGTCFIEGIWLDTPLSPGEIVSVLACRDSSNQFYVGNSSGLLVLRPDHLISSTSVVGGVFCKRRAILQERWRGIDSANTAMTIGILIHELVQKALTQNISDARQLTSEANTIIKASLQRLYDAGITEEEAQSNIQIYISPLSEFMKNYVGITPPTVVRQQSQKDKWNGHIDKVLDIEENLCCPQLGLKGKIDATLQVTIHDRKGRQKAIVPLELKSGKASVSAEHRGQLVLYGMMLSLQRDEDPTTSSQRGLLLYLKERVELREVSCGHPERRDLVMLRNQLVQNLAPAPTDVDVEQIEDIEEASALLQQSLPDPVHHENACAKCPYLTLCSLHLWHCDGPSVSETHPLSKLRPTALGHLSADHIKYFLQWTALLKIEERAQNSTAPLHALWTDTVEKRAKRGSCAPNLTLKSVQQSDDRYLHVFERQVSADSKGPTEGEFSIVSLDKRPWIAAGVILVAKDKEIHILLERDLSPRLNKGTYFHIDTYESYATAVHNLTNLGVLLEDSDRALRLRKLIIDKEEPQFDKKLPRDVGRLGTKLMRSLNIQQQRAVLKALAAKDYALLRGLPGTGKTQTISVLIQMLVGLKQRVLVTAHTHSAVDNVLSRLPASMSVMRLGAEGRVARAVAGRCEQRLADHCRSTHELETLYDSMEVVGVTCLGAAHAMLTRAMFDVCIVDEATQVLQCTVLRPLFAAKRFVLVGDPDQLPPVVRSRAARRLGMEESLFHRLMREEATSTLQLQYRMNQALVDIANKVAYNSRLKCADENIAQAKLNLDVQKISYKSDWISKACSILPEMAAVFLDVMATEPSRSCTNETEGCVVLALAEALVEGGVKPSDIGVIAPYRDQVSLLRRSLAYLPVEASTVDQFQGRDKSVIIYSCTRSDVREDDSKVREGEVLNDQRRLAVSVTRAKHKFIIVGNSKALQRYVPLQRLIEASVQVPLSKDVVCEIESRYRNMVT